MIKAVVLASANLRSSFVGGDEVFQADQRTVKCSGLCIFERSKRLRIQEPIKMQFLGSLSVVDGEEERRRSSRRGER